MRNQYKKEQLFQACLKETVRARYTEHTVQKVKLVAKARIMRRLYRSSIRRRRTENCIKRS